MCATLSWYSIYSNDIFIFLAISYASVNLIFQWDVFEKCSQPLHYWLLASFAGIFLYKTVVLLFNQEPEDDNDQESLRIIIFKPGYKLYSIISVGFLYPTSVIWNLLGTVWYILDMNSETNCLISEEAINWNILTWIILFYIGIIIWTTVIIYASIIYHTNLVFERQFNRLLEQYEGEERPRLEFGLNGLTPDQIIQIPVKVVGVNDGECSICIDSFKEAQRARQLSCGHLYHLPCVDKWLMQHPSCPLCKALVK